MKKLTELEFRVYALDNKLSLLSELPSNYTGGFVVNEKCIYALNKANHLVAYYNNALNEYHLYDAPMKGFSKTKRKFKKLN